MTRIDEIRDRLDKITLWMNQTQYGNVTYAYVTMLANAQDDLAWLLDTVARRDARCADLAVQLDAEPTDAEVEAVAWALDPDTWEALRDLDDSSCIAYIRALVLRRDTSLVKAREVLIAAQEARE